jgi:hypothetical protein
MNWDDGLRDLRPLALVGVILTAPLFPGSAQAFDVDTCGQTVPRGEIGVLQTDLTCPQGALSIAVTLDRRATLDLNGHTLTGGDVSVACSGARCKVVGPGEIVGSTAYGIWGQLGIRHIDVENVVLRDHEFQAIFLNSFHGSLKLTGVTLRDIDLTRAGIGLALPAAQASRVKFTDVTAINVHPTVFGARTKGTNLIADGCTSAIVGKAKVTGLVATNSLREAVRTPSGKLRLRDSMLFDNDLNSGNGIDIVSLKRPALRDSTCFRSEQCIKATAGIDCLPQPGTSWRVCTDDF